MKNMMIFLILILWLGPTGSYAASTKDKRMDEVLGAYLKIQESLANDSLEHVQIEAAKIAKHSSKKDLKLPAQALSHDTSLEAARSDFKRLSVAMNKWAKEVNPVNVDRVTCSMADATWLQKRGDIKNPYYGKQMQSCGEVQK